MKRTCKSAVVLMLIATVLVLSSCNGLFTSSVMKGAARDPEKAAAALAKKPTATLVADAADAADQSSAQAVVGALSKKAKDDPNFASNLNEDEKKTVINAAMTAVINLPAIAGDSSINLAGMMNGDIDSADEDEMMENIVSSIINNLGDCDTTCVASILDASYDNGQIAAGTSPEMKSSLALGAITVAAATMKGSNFDMDEFMDALEDGNGSVDASDVLPGASPADLANLTTAMNILNALSADTSFDMSSIFGM